MAPSLGKRKRRDQIDSMANVSESCTEDDSAHLQALSRRHFEATFEPLQSLSLSCTGRDIGTDTYNEEPESDWNGFSEDEENRVETIQYATYPKPTSEIPKDEIKIFTATKPSFGTGRTGSTAKQKSRESIDPDDAVTEAAELKKDLALQRLLKESHLLGAPSNLSHTGQTRHKAFDLRLQDMGSKSSIYTQQKMPLAHRKGIIAKARAREETRRREAHKNGIIIEKPTKSRGIINSKRQRGIDAPSIGKFQGGMLKLSKKDVAEIEGPKRSSKYTR